MLYNVGDVVKIRDDLEIDKYYNDCYFNKFMNEYSGTIQVIDKIDEIDKTNKFFKLRDIDFSWSEEMFEGKIVNADVDKIENLIEPCFFCETKKFMLTKNGTIDIVNGNRLEIDSNLDGLTDVEINYCPICGRKLERVIDKGYKISK